MPQLKQVPQRTADFLIMPLTDGTLCIDTIDNSIKYINKYTYECVAFLTELPEGATCESSLASGVKMLDDGTCLVFMDESLDQQDKEAIEFMCTNSEYSEIMFSYYGSDLRGFSKILTDCGHLEMVDSDFDVVEFSDGTEIYFLEVE